MDESTLDGLEPVGLIDGTLVIECPGAMSGDNHQRIRDELERRLPGRKVLILCDGMRVSREAQLDRLEKKLDLILEQTRKPTWVGGPM